MSAVGYGIKSYDYLTKEDEEPDINTVMHTSRFDRKLHTINYVSLEEEVDELAVPPKENIK